MVCTLVCRIIDVPTKALFLILSAPQEPITVNISSAELAGGHGNSSNSVNVQFRWSQPSNRNGSYYFELVYSAEQNFDGGRSMAAVNISQIPEEQLSMQFSNGLPYAEYAVTIFAYNIKRGRSYGGPLANRTYLSIPISKW